jgi:hypothetical protein
MTASAITRAQIPGLTVGMSVFMVTGNTTPGDSGAGGMYIAGNSSGHMAIQDASGAWYNLVTKGQFFDTVLQGYSIKTSTSSSTVLAPVDIVGGVSEHTLNLTGVINVPSYAQLPTVSALVTYIGNAIACQTYKLRVTNGGGVGFGTWTINSNTGWLLNGPMTIPVGKTVEFYVKLTSLTTATLQNVSSPSVLNPYTTLKGLAAGSSAVQLTVDGLSAGAANVCNILPSVSASLNVSIVARDMTTNGNNAAWANWPMLLTQDSGGVATTNLIVSSPPTYLGNGTLTGMQVAASADVTNGGLYLSFTPPTSNTNTWHISALVTSVEAS